MIGESGGLAVTFLEETQTLLSRFVCVYFGYISQGAAVVALAGCHEPTCQMLLFPYTHFTVVWEADDCLLAESLVASVLKTDV